MHDQRDPGPGEEEHAGEAEQDELDGQRAEGDRDQAEDGSDAGDDEDGGDDPAGGTEPGHKIQQAEPEEKAEKETTEDIDRAFD